MNKRKCNHKWVAMEDGTNDKLCIRCRKFAMQAVAVIPNAININEAIENAMHEPTTLESIANELQRQVGRSKRMKGVF
ncbi:MAG TPA: hypothetical protein VK085_06130 [Pseudogracilibacillus sp.]|nr:hypothetical protein [Pseudogracilibacillus sp.]